MTAASVSPPRRLAITVRGVVQGVGFRPFVYQAARDRQLAGWVCNEADTVRIEVQGHAAALDSFIEALRQAHPPQACIDDIQIEETSPQSELTDSGRPVAFEIRASMGMAAPRPTIPADLATCPECLAEIRDPSQRRYNYPFTNCTNCGPRWSIIEQLPYDRPRTSMAGFALCTDCRVEYENPGDRRFHAQPIACPRCGPTLQLLDSQGRDLVGQVGNLSHNTSQAALDGAVQAILGGQIVAMKGLGGFQLLADATNAEAVARLRRRKRRPDRPFAVMLPSLDDVRQYCEVSNDEARSLVSHQSPIVLLRRRSASSPLSFVAPDNPYLGVMLPYTPLHHLLMAAVARPIICTSGNLSEEPMAITTEDAIARLGPIADVLLTHNRPIVRPVDDSIVRVGSDGIEVLRRARGFAPLPIQLLPSPDQPSVGARRGAGGEGGRKDTPTILALGGHLKNTVALALGSDGDTRHQPTQVVMSAHVSDLDSVLSTEVFRRAADDLLQFFRVAPETVVCDLHPDYASTRHAERLASQYGVPLLRVQHHHAHIAACMAEHGLRGPVLGFSWDGTGYGPDGTVWGGETLWCEGAEFRRVAHLRTFALPGGDVAMREPRRSALGLLFEIFGSDVVGQVANLPCNRANKPAPAWFEPSQLNTLVSMLSRQINTPRTSSMGRLFDAVAALCGLPPVITFEGQAAMALEFAADEREQAAYGFTLSACGAGIPSAVPMQPGRPHHNATVGQVGNLSHKTIVADWEPMIRSILSDRAAGVPIGLVSARFHNALADLAVAIARGAVDIVGQVSNNLSYSSAPLALPIVLTGGCFQNALLTDRVRSRLSAAGFRVYTHRQVPPGDGGIALGQAFVALQSLATRSWEKLSTS